LLRAKQRSANNQENDNILTVGSAAGGLQLVAGFYNGKTAQNTPFFARTLNQHHSYNIAGSMKCEIA
jgi:hypothetical protein